MSVDRCREETSSSQFQDWILMMESEWRDDRAKWEHYAARIILSIKQLKLVLIDDPAVRALTEKDMLIDFITEKDKAAQPKKEEDLVDKQAAEKEFYTKTSKMVWGARLAPIARGLARKKDLNVQSDGSRRKPSSQASG